MKSTGMETLTVIGCGNRNRSDDGVGPVIVELLNERLRDFRAPNINIFDTGSGGMDVMFRARGSSELIIVDACTSGSVAGSIFELPAEALRVPHDPIVNSHEFKWQHAIYAGRQIYAQDFPKHIRVILIESAHTGIGLQLTAAVSDAASRVAEQLFSELLPRIEKHSNRGRISYETALRIAAEDKLSPSATAKMLADLAHDIQGQDNGPENLQYSADLLRRATTLPDLSAHDRAQLHVSLATTLLQFPSSDSPALHEAQFLLADAIGKLSDPEEQASAQMQQALVIQSLAAIGHADSRQAIQCYQQALAVFTAQSYPVEYALIHNNMATIWLSLSLSPEKRHWYESVAIDSFETALRHLSEQEHPNEYAMLQNNLGNTLQNRDSGDRLKNKHRALQAYNEALKYRQTSSLLRANTLANRAQCLIDLPDADDMPQRGNARNLRCARDSASEALAIFQQHHERERAQVVSALLAEIDQLTAGGTEHEP